MPDQRTRIIYYGDNLDICQCIGRETPSYSYSARQSCAQSGAFAQEGGPADAPTPVVRRN